MSFDFDATKLLVEGYAQENYRKVYSQTNEHLRQLYSNVDFSDKKVLSVAASGDQAFLAYAFGAKHIDLFDINKITLYYYYLRLWTIKYFNRFYPKIPFHKKFLKDLLQMVQIRDGAEKIAFDYWRAVLDEFDNKMLERMFVYDGKYLEVSAGELSVIKKAIDSDKSTFYNVDISDYVNIKNKYDIIVTSNIYEWIRRWNVAIEEYRDNLYSLLNDGGVVLCSNMATNHQKNIFEKDFEYCKFPSFKKSANCSVTPGYAFIKRR